MPEEDKGPNAGPSAAQAKAFDLYDKQDVIIDRQKKERATSIIGGLYILFAIISFGLVVWIPDINFLVMSLTFVVMAIIYFAYRREGTLRLTAAVFMLVSGGLGLFIFGVGTFYMPNMIFLTWFVIAFSVFGVIGGACAALKRRHTVALMAAFFCIFITYIMGLLAFIIMFFVEDEFLD